ncbi:hypothetical protein FACS1894105_13080 [Clostridia bacterium]|nr:hypothetical protein FACS1894105_13080 [Clostridia bacterium]
MLLKIKKLPLSSILAALCVVALAIPSVIPTITYAASFLAGLIVIMSVIEIRGYYPILIYLTSSLIAVLILPNKNPAVLFALIFGVYPIFKAYIERYHPVLAYAVKISAFNVWMTASLFILKQAVSGGFEINYGTIFDKAFESVTFGLIFYAVANAVFIAYDIALTYMTTMYIVKLRPKLGFGVNI